MEVRAGQTVVHYAEHGSGRPVLVLHGAGVDHREAEACFEPALDGAAGLRRIYPDLPGMGRTAAPEALRSADDVLGTLLGFADEVTGEAAYLLIGHSAGAYFAQAMAASRPARVAGLVDARRRALAGLPGSDDGRGGTAGLGGRVCGCRRPH